mmetsp:Transcript_100399/g.224224  ORF Transcript_100399/g.224224 Transcript_100399/m.224224 type:complete len:111 (+) Transcript_100399:674-1006(+)
MATFIELVCQSFGVAWGQWVTVAMQRTERITDIYEASLRMLRLWAKFRYQPQPCADALQFRVQAAHFLVEELTEAIAPRVIRIKKRSGRIIDFDERLQRCFGLLGKQALQ